MSVLTHEEAEASVARAFAVDPALEVRATFETSPLGPRPTHRPAGGGTGPDLRPAPASPLINTPANYHPFPEWRNPSRAMLAHAR